MSIYRTATVVINIAAAEDNGSTALANYIAMLIMNKRFDPDMELIAMRSAGYTCLSGAANVTISMDTNYAASETYKICALLNDMVEDAFKAIRSRAKRKVVLIVNGPVHTIETFETE